MNGYQVEEMLKEFAPYELAYEGEELGFVTGNPEKEIKRIAVTWRPTIELLKKCVDLNIDMLINHEPLYQSKKSSIIPISELKFSPNQRREELVLKNDLLVLRAHSNWDDAINGNNETLASILRIQVDEKIPYGRIGMIKKQSLDKFVKFVKSTLGCKDVLVVGNLRKELIKAAVVSGSGNALTEMIEYSYLKGADVLVSGDIQDSRARYASELGIAIIDAGGYYTETPGMKRLSELFKQALRKKADVVYLDPGPPWHFV